MVSPPDATSWTFTISRGWLVSSLRNCPRIEYFWEIPPRLGPGPVRCCAERFRQRNKKTGTNARRRGIITPQGWNHQLAQFYHYGEKVTRIKFAAACRLSRPG